MTRSTQDPHVLPRGFDAAALPLSHQTLTYVTGIIRRRAQTGSPWRKLAPGQQAPLVLAYRRKGETFDSAWSSCYAVTTG
jgi:hypothetical protein